MAQLPEAQVEISPDLHVRGVGSYHLSGALLIPRAKVGLRELPRSAVAISEDEILIVEQTQAPPAGATKNLTAKARVELGADVTFCGFGLGTGVIYAMDAATDASGTRLDDEIDLRDGRYKAYGDNLEIERGPLVFAGPPTNPDVDLRAVRVLHYAQASAFLGVARPLSKPSA